MEAIAPMIMRITLILTPGGVILFRPFPRRLGALIDVMIQERDKPATVPELAQTRDTLSTTDSRLSLVEERPDFAEALLNGGDCQTRRARSGAGERAFTGHG